ncbi:MAG: glutathione S-transferase N-terminal domain-containing protein [Alphaproteobacteria bacterium]|nr:glutathione S-transferase N-terminal domain-containing protein [Alphaproteobacteria bacterium]
MLTLYDYELSGDCYKVRLLLQLLGLSYDRRHVDAYPGAEHRSDWFLALSPLGDLPVVEDDGALLADPGAILVYLACRYDPTGTWYPRADAARLGAVTQWLFRAARLAGSAGAARLHDGFFLEADIGQARREAYALLELFDEHLWFAEERGEPWLCPGANPTIADLACFPDIMLSEEGGIFHRRFPAVRRWTDRVKRIPGFIVMPGIFPASTAGAT